MKTVIAGLGIGLVTALGWLIVDYQFDLLDLETELRHLRQSRSYAVTATISKNENEINKLQSKVAKLENTVETLIVIQEIP